MATNTPFIWGSGGRKLTPQEAAARREIENAILEKGIDFSPVADPFQGLGRVANAAAGAFRRSRLGADEADIASRNKALVSPILAALTGGSTAAAPSSIPMTSAAGEVAATAPPAGGPQAYRDAIASIESAGSGDYSAVGPTNPKLGRALGRYQIMEANIGPWSQEALGRVVTPDEFLANPQLQDAIFDKKFGSYVEQFGPEGAAQAWFAGPGGVGKVDRQDVLGTNVGEYGSRFINALGTGGGNPAAEAINAVAPMDAPVDVGAASPIAGVQEQPMPVQVAGGGDRVPMATPSINPAIIEALTDPQATPQTQTLARIVLEQQQRQAQAAEEQRLQAADPLRQLQIQKGQLELEQMRNPTPGFRTLSTEEKTALGLPPQGAFQMNREGQISQIGGGGVNITNEGTIPAGYQAVRDAQGRVTSVQPLPGSPAALEMEQALRTRETQGGRKQTSTDVITNAAANARQLIKSGTMTTGTLGRIASNLTESDAAELRRQVDVLKSNATIENLTAMRQASPTGGALGSVTEKEGAMLAAAAGAIDPNAGNQQVAKQLDNYERTLLRVIHGPKVGDAIFEQTRQEKPLSEMTDEELEALANGD